MAFIVKDRQCPKDCLRCGFSQSCYKGDNLYVLVCGLSRMIVEDWCDGERPPFCDLVDMQATATWVKENTRPKSMNWLCSNCGQVVSPVSFDAVDVGQLKKCSYHYCPNCGAVMNEGATHETD